MGAAAFLAGESPSLNLSVKAVYDRLYAIAQDEGRGSVERKVSAMARLLKELGGQGGKYVVRIALGRLRLGFSDLTILDALSWWVGGDKSLRKRIEKAYQVRTDVGFIARTLKKKGIEGLKEVKLALGTPVVPALCQRLATTEEIIAKMGRVAVEPKYDGTRVQFHFSRKLASKKEETLFDFRPQGMVRSFTRNLEDVTKMFPDLVDASFGEIKAEEAVLDGEVVGFDPQTGKLRPFQETIRRKRKYQVAETAQEIPIRFYAFDLLACDGEELLRLPFEKRRARLEKVVGGGRVFCLSPQIITEKAEELLAYHAAQIKEGLEGVVVKKLKSAYDPGRRGFTWVKLKQEKGKKGGGLADTLDCLVMGYYLGKGKRTGFGIGKILVGVKRGEEFVTLTKVGTGLTDEKWREVKRRCDKLAVKERPNDYRVDKHLQPDIWCRPGLVVEIEADNVTHSPIHLAGFSMRFPRWVRFRDDKGEGEVSNLGEVKRLFELQT